MTAADDAVSAGLGPLSAVYPHRLYALADAVRSNSDRLFAEAPAPQKLGEGYIRVDPALRALIESILLSAANIRKLLHPAKDRGPKESAGAFRVRVIRTKMLGALVAGLDTTEIKNTQARNALEHFDEKLDDISAHLLAGTKRFGAAIPFNLILSRHDLLDQFSIGDQFPLSVYDASERVFRIMTYRVDLQRVRNEAAAIADRLRPTVVSRPEETGAGGMVILLGPRKPV